MAPDRLGRLCEEPAHDDRHPCTRPVRGCAISKASAILPASAPSPTRRPAPASLLSSRRSGAPTPAGALLPRIPARWRMPVGRRRDLPPSRHHPRRRPRPHGRCRDRLRLLPAAPRQPGRDHHRLGRQRGLDGGHSVGARSGIAGYRGGHPAPADGDAAVLRLGAEPDRRDGAGDRRGRLRADGRAGAPVRTHRHDPADQLAGQRGSREEDGRRAGADHRDARQADPDDDLHDRHAGRDRDLRQAGIPCYTSMPSCARAINALVDYGAFREHLAAATPRSSPAGAPRRVARALRCPARC